MAIWTSGDKELFALAIPTFASLVSEPLLVLADTAFVGRLGAVPLAGLGIGGNVLGIVTGMCVFLAYATTSTTAKLFGGGDKRAAFSAGRDGMALGAIIGTILALALAALAPVIIGWYHPQALVAVAAISYLRIVAFGLPFQLIVLASTGLLRGLQDARTPMTVAVSVNVVNIGLDALLIYGFGFGIRGSAIATMTAQACSCVVLVALIMRRARKENANGAQIGLRPTLRGMGEAASHGGWLVIRSASLWASLTATTFVATRMGMLVLAAHQVINSIWNFLSYALDALAIACQALIGRRLGAHDGRGARLVMRRALGWGAVQACVVGLLLVLFRSVIVRLFTADQTVISLLMGALVVLSFLQPLASVVFVLDGVLIGAGDTRYLALAGLFVVACHVPLLMLLVHGDGAHHFHNGLIWLWIVYGGFLLARCITLVPRAIAGRWVDK